MSTTSYVQSHELISQDSVEDSSMTDRLKSSESDDFSSSDVIVASVVALVAAAAPPSGDGGLK